MIYNGTIMKHLTVHRVFKHSKVNIYFLPLLERSYLYFLII